MGFIRKKYFDLSNFYLRMITFISISLDLKQPPALSIRKGKGFNGRLIG